ncbi:hypothetical protein PYV50_15275 [Pseudomonas sp. H22_DOA]|nr:hypothetical protein PYV50_15275 [Pseudomonas sp. H22_DOA]
MSDFNATEIPDDEDSLDAELIAEFELDRQDAALSELADLIHESNVAPGSNIGLAKNWSWIRLDHFLCRTTRAIAILCGHLKMRTTRFLTALNSIARWKDRTL